MLPEGKQRARLLSNGAELCLLECFCRLTGYWLREKTGVSGMQFAMPVKGLRVEL